MGVFVSYNIPFRRNLLMQITNSIITFGGSLRQKNKKDFLTYSLILIKYTKTMLKKLLKKLISKKKS